MKKDKVTLRKYPATKEYLELIEKYSLGFISEGQLHNDLNKLTDRKRSQWITKKNLKEQAKQARIKINFE